MTKKSKVDMLFHCLSYTEPKRRKKPMIDRNDGDRILSELARYLNVDPYLLEKALIKLAGEE